MPNLIVSRTSERDIKFRDLVIEIDGEYVGNVKFGRSLELDLQPGPHSLLATNSLYKKTAEFEIKPGEVTRFEVANVFTPLGMVMMSTIGIGPYKIVLEQLENEQSNTSD